MNNLTKQHLMPYLPYDLKAIDEFGKIRVVDIFHQSYSNSMVGLNHMIFNDNVQVYCFMPILRNLTDLTREHHIVIGRTLTHDMQKHEVFAYEDSKAWIRGGMMPVMSLERCLNVTQYLFSIHADVFGLIKQGLAVDIENISK